LVDINMGQKILVRLRHAGAPDAFYPEEEVIHTMLHEVLLLHLCYLLFARAQLPSFFSSHITYMVPMTKPFTSFYPVLKKNIMNSSVLDTQVKDSSPTDVD
jgi:WLM domain